MSNPKQKNSNYNRSLTILTRRFLELLKSNPESLNLKSASQILNLQTKRRIYDVTNVLEGIGLVEKIGRSSVRLIASASRSNNLKTYSNQLKTERAELREKEKKMKRLCKIMKMNLKHFRNDKISQSYSYVTRDDILDSFGPDSTIILVKNHESISSTASVAGAGDILQKVTYQPTSHNTSSNSAERNTTASDINNNRDANILVIKAPEYCKLDVKLVSTANSTFVSKLNNDTDAGNHPKSICVERKSTRALTLDERRDLDRRITASIILRHFREDARRSKYEPLHTQGDVSPALISIELPCTSEYPFALDESEGICDLFDIR